MTPRGMKLSLGGMAGGALAALLLAAALVVFAAFARGFRIEEAFARARG